MSVSNPSLLGLLLLLLLIISFYDDKVSSSQLGTLVPLSTVSNVSVYNGETNGGIFAYSVVCIGDLNGDGNADYAVGAPDG